MILAAVDVVDGELARGARIAGGAVGDAAIFLDGGVLGGRGGDGGVVVGAGDGDVDVVAGGAVDGGDDEVLVDDLTVGQMVGERLVEGVGPRARGRVEGEA